jgi:dihydropteroate synthase
MTLPPPAAVLRLGGRQFPPGQLLVMAVINPAPDTYSPAPRGSGPDTGALDRAAAAADRAAAEGADIIDTGGARAGAGAPVSVQEELDQVVPLIARLRAEHPELLLSLDTWRSAVAAAACSAGADLVNDTWAGHDPDLPPAVGRVGAGQVSEHTGGLPPQALPHRASYGEEPEDVVDEVIGALMGAARRASEAGVPPDSILLDPTLDVGKNTWHGLALLRRVDALATLGHPVLMSASRTDLIGETLGLPAGERLEGTLAATSLSAWLGAKVFRVDDVRSTRRALDMISAIRGDRPPVRPLRGLA